MPDDNAQDKPSVKERIAHILLGLGVLVGGGVAGALGGQMTRRENSPSPAPPDKPPEEPGYETTDLPARRLLWIGIGFIAVLAAVGLVTILFQYWLMGYAVAPYAVAPNLTPPPGVTLPAEPRPEALPGSALRELNARAQEQLNSYGWVNQRAGVVHIPIERAMQLLIQRGLPVAPGHASTSFDDAGNLLPSSSSSGRMMERVFP